MKISSINIENSLTKFNDSQKITIPNNDKYNNCVFIYGKNGTGKSSISKLFFLNNLCLEDKDYIESLSQLKTKNSSKELNVKIIYDNGLENTFTTNSIINPIKVPVFNKDYINSKITHQEDFKNNKIPEKNMIYSIELMSKTKYLEKMKEYEREIKNKEEIELKINNKIKNEIENIKNDTSTKESNKNYKIFDLENLKNIDKKEIPNEEVLKRKRLEHIKYIQSLKDLSEKNKIHFNIEFLNPNIDFKREIENINRSLTFNEDESKTAAAREILDKFDDEQKEWKIKGVSYISNEKCPFCGESVDKNELVSMYKNYANSKINKMKQYLSTEINKIENYKKNTNYNYEICINNIEYLDSIFQTNLASQIESFKNEINSYLEKVLNLLRTKSTNKYLFIDSSKIINSIDINELKTIKSSYEKLVKDINKINKKVDSSTSDKTKRNDSYFKQVALNLTYYAIKNEIEEIKKCEIKIETIKTELKILKREYEKEVHEKNILVRKMNGILDDFNISNYRIDEEFNLCLNEEKVSFCVDKLLSDGEKSIIAFSLFIAELELYYTDTEKSIIVIDDPISSVDYPNLYGIYNYINNLIEYNPNSQFIICSHNTMFMNLFKFDYPKNKAIYFKFTDIKGKTKIEKDDGDLDSIYLEKLKEIFLVYKTRNITNTQKLYIHNYCRYVLETISRFEYPNNNKESISSKFYIKKIIDNIKDRISDYGISKVSLQSLTKIINKGSHATIDEVHDGERFEDNHYIDSCTAIIKFIKKDYNGQYELLSSDYSKNSKDND